MKPEIYEVIKEYTLDVDGLDFTVKGRISKIKNNERELPFCWDISHHYKPTKGAGVYYPSKMSTKTFEEAENFLLAYMVCFTTIGVTPDKNY